MPTNAISNDLLASLPGYDPFRLAGDAVFDHAAARLAIDFFPECLKHVEGDLAGQPFELEPWQQAIVANLFGWKVKDRRGRTVRRYREAFIYVPRKNGKTPLSAGIALFVFFADQEKGQQDYIAAGDREQAGMLFRQAKGMVEQDAELSRRCRIYGGNAAAGQSRSIVIEAEHSFLRVVSADAESKHGGNTHLAVIDELHVQPNRDLYDVFKTSMASANRPQPLLITVTTADYQRPSICNEVYDYACKVRDGFIDDPCFLPVIYEALPVEPWDSPAVWARVNPNLGVSVSPEYLEREAQRAKDVPAYENTFKRLHLNLRTEQDVRWITSELWAKGGAPFDPDLLLGRECWAGIDFGWRDDYAALVLTFPVDGLYYFLPYFWLPRECRRDRRAHPTSEFVAQKLVTLTDGNATDVEAIYTTLRDCREKYDIREIVLDPHNARKQGQDFQEDAYTVVEFYQSKKNYNEPCRFLEHLLKEGKIRHGNHPVLTWMAGNVTVEQNGAGEIMPKKVKSTEKIDGICALLMGLARAMLSPEGGSIYDSQGVLLVEEPDPASRPPAEQPWSFGPAGDDDW